MFKGIVVCLALIACAYWLMIARAPEMDDDGVFIGPPEFGWVDTILGAGIIGLLAIVALMLGG